MSCCIRFKGHRAVETDRHADSTDPIKGTWDYKWPLHTKIRVAFQELPPGISTPQQFREAKLKIQELAKLWLKDPVGIGFEFIDEDLPPPDDKEPSVAEHQAQPQAQKVKHPHRRSKLTSPERPKYDVLVSLEPLPVALTDTLAEGKEDDVESVFLPFSQLGSFAERLDYGTPTMFLGPLNAEMSLSEYYDREVAQMMVVHEFGHVLGLAHEHQSPELRKVLALRPDDYDLEKVKEIWIHRIGVDRAQLDKNDGEFLESHLTDGWPGNARFSDWRQYPEKPRTLKLDSVMAVPYHECSLKREAASRLGIEACNCSPRESRRSCGALFTAPTQADLDFLKQMYPPN